MEWVGAPRVLVFPPAPRSAALGWVAKAVPPVELEGCWLKASFAAAPTVTLNELESAAVSAPSLACSVYPFPATSILQPESVNTPLASLAEHPDSVPPLG